MVLYFAYGSNLDRQQMSQRCPEASILSPGYLPEYKLAFTQFDAGWGGGVADIVRDPSSTVWGILYKLTPADLKRLDYYEEYPSYYTRKQHNVVTMDNQFLSAWVYSVVDKKKDFVPPTIRYLEIIKRAAKDFGFPDKYVSCLSRIKTVGA